MDFKDKFVLNASIIGDPARAAILWCLIDGKAYTATELADVANISRQSASNHLNKLLDAGLLIVKTQGRHRYYSFANDDVAYAIEALANLIPGFSLKKIKTKNPGNTELFFARTCYDHLAGNLAVKLTTSLINNNLLTKNENKFFISEKGNILFNELGINTDKLKVKQRILIRPCLDWTERKYHIGGSLGAELLKTMLKNDWVREVKNSRKILLTPKGSIDFTKIFGITFE